MFFNILAVGAGGFVGAVLRYSLSILMPYRGGFPWTTFTINTLGSFILAFLVHAALARWGVPETISLGLKVGLCGGFTTFSTFSVETLTLLESGQWVIAVSYVLASVLAGVIAAILGVYLASGI